MPRACVERRPAQAPSIDRSFNCTRLSSSALYCARVVFCINTRNKKGGIRTQALPRGRAVTSTTLEHERAPVASSE